MDRAADILDLYSLVVFFAGRIQNGRTLADIFDHGGREMVELRDELKLDAAGLPGGPDGVVGEAIDVVLCMFDLIHVARPDLTSDDVVRMAVPKLQKWARRYKDSVAGDRSID